MTSSVPRRPLSTLAAIGFAVAFTACGNATESGIEKLIESQGGGDVDLDLSGDGGGFSVQTEEGGMSIDEDGNFVITDADGKVVTGNADSETGGFTAESEDGSFRVDASGDIPEEWPSDVPSPTGLDSLSSSVSQSASELAITVTGQAGESFVDDYGSTLENSGFERTSNFESAANITRVYENGTLTVSVNSFSDGDASQVAVSLFPASS